MWWWLELELTLDGDLGGALGGDLAGDLGGDLGVNYWVWDAGGCNDLLVALQSN